MGFWKTIVQWVAVIEHWVYEWCANDVGCTEVEDRANASEIPDVVEARVRVYRKYSYIHMHALWRKSDWPQHGWIFAQLHVYTSRSFFQSCLGDLERSFLVANRSAQECHRALHFLHFASRLQHHSTSSLSSRGTVYVRMGRRHVAAGRVFSSSDIFLVSRVIVMLTPLAYGMAVFTTSIRLPFDWLSKVVKVTMTKRQSCWPISY